ncbi:hypothetical protein CO614_02175 [Lysobacteraceae bacterium NML120232]|nr:hypothetical protein CO614_02175 [Xanthomonadaceae bacterium NML120232]
MNLDLDTLATHSQNPVQQKALDGLRKQCTLSNAKGRDTLLALTASFYVHDQREALHLLLPALAAQRFAGNFDVWHPVETLLGILLALPDLSADERAALLAAVDSVRSYPKPRFAGMYDAYNDNILALTRLQNAEEDLAENIREDGPKDEYHGRVRLLAEAALAQALSQDRDAALARQMAELIAQQTAELRAPRLGIFATAPKARNIQTPAQKAANPVARIPKKLVVVFDILRSGQIEEGLAQLAQIDGFAPQKAAAQAEVAYFQSDFARAMTLDESWWPQSKQWYAINPLAEHLLAYAWAAKANGQVAHAQKQLRAAFPASLKIAQNALAALTAPDPAPAAERQSGRSMDDLLAQLKQYKPKYRPYSADGVRYLLHFVLIEASTRDALTYYEAHCALVDSFDHHMNAARLYHAVGDTAAAQAAICRAAPHFAPVEHTQVAPMRLWEYRSLTPLYTPDLLQTLLRMDKNQAA